MFWLLKNAESSNTGPTSIPEIIFCSRILVPMECRLKHSILARGEFSAIRLCFEAVMAADPGDTSRDSVAAGRGLFDFSFGAGGGADRSQSGPSFTDLGNVRPTHMVGVH